MTNITVKYHSAKMLMTIDLNMLFQVLLDIYGSYLIIKFELMNKSEQIHATETVDGLVAVKERFWILEGGETENLNRRKDLEKKIIMAGAK